MVDSILSTELKSLIPGEQYTRSELYDVFHVPANQQRGDWDTGYHLHENIWFIFAMVSGPARTGHDHGNFWAKDGSFVWHGKRGASQKHPSIRSLTSSGRTILLFARENDRDPFTFHGEVVPRDVQDSVPVKVVWQVRSTPSGTSDIPYLKNVAPSNFYAQMKEVIAREMPLDPGKTIECNVQKIGGYELAVEVIIKEGEEFISNREYRDPTRFPARIRAAATALRDSGNFGPYLISHHDSVITVTHGRDPFAPTADEAELERATKKLLASGTMREPAGSEQPEKVETIQGAFVRDPRVRAWVLATAKGFCEACANPGPFIADNGSPFLEVHHVKMLADGGPDKTTNAVALCPNCHRRFHYSLDRESFVESIYGRVSRLIRQ